MGKILNFYEFINEGLSEVLFHYTKPAQAVSMLHGNSFALLPVVTDDIDASINRGKMYYMSFTRSGSKAGYAGTKVGNIVGSNCAVRLRIDGALLQSKNKGAAVDYMKDDTFRNVGHDEMEDRVFSDKRLIGGATKMIKEVHVLLLNKKSSDRAKNIKDIIDLKDLCEEHRIPFHFFDNRADFDNAVAKKLRGVNIPAPESVSYEGKDSEKIEEEVEDFIVMLAWISLAGYEGSVEGLLLNQEFNENLRFMGKTKEWVHDQVKDKMEDILKEDEHDAAHWLQALFVNHRKYKSNGAMSTAIDVIVSIMKKMKTNTIMAFAKAVLSKANKTATA